MAYERDNIQDVEAYVPGEQPVDAAIIKLNTNENPYPPVDAVMEAISSVGADALRRYPSPAASEFREVAARVHGLSPGQVIATNGGDELLRLAMTAFCEPSPSGAGARSDLDEKSDAGGNCHGGIGVFEPSYSLYPVLAKLHDTPVVRVDLNEDFSIATDSVDAMVDQGVGLVLIVNPHAPSGRVYLLEQLGAIARKLVGRAVLLIDEAYVDFAQGDMLNLLSSPDYADLDNVLVLRTLSKGYSLAGLRFGYGLGHANLIAAMDKARDSYNTDALSQAAATAALEHRDEASRSWDAVASERVRLAAALVDRGMVVPESHANFVLATVPENWLSGDNGEAGGAGSISEFGSDFKPTAAIVYESLKARLIFVRYFDQAGLSDKLRITVGTPQQNDALLNALDVIRGENAGE